MQVAISHKPLQTGSKNRGVGVYTRELISALHKHVPSVVVRPTSKANEAEDVDLIHYPFFDPFFLTLPAHYNKPTVITIHDLIPLRFPEHFRPGLRGKLKLWLQRKRAQKASAIITDSEASKADIMKYFQIPDGKIHAIKLAHTIEKVPTTIAKKIATKYKLPERYLLYVGDINWNKNVTGLIDAFARLEDPTLHLVLLGKEFGKKPNIKEYKNIAQAISESGKKDYIHEIGYAPNHHLPVFYRLATLYVQPSWYEGFGLPILEAMSYGCPVASSDRGSLAEVGGEAVAYFDPAKDMTQVLSNLVKNTRQRNLLIKKGLERVKLFSWKKTAEETAQVYELVLDQIKN
jgi:glycosyltransferase involved in cell wall biosynthesis